MNHTVQSKNTVKQTAIESCKTEQQNEDAWRAWKAASMELLCPQFREQQVMLTSRIFLAAILIIFPNRKECSFTGE
jgi:hypothetical protein